MTENPAAPQPAPCDPAAEPPAETRDDPRAEPMRPPLDDLPRDMNEAAKELVRRYASAHLDKSDGPVDFSVYVVWQCHILGNAKWLLSTTLRDGMYYEVTYGAGQMQYYLDAYKKFDNVCVDAVRGYA